MRIAVGSPAVKHQIHARVTVRRAVPSLAMGGDFDGQHSLVELEMVVHPRESGLQVCRNAAPIG